MVVTITYGSTTLGFDDSSNSNYPRPDTLDILVLTTNIQFACSLSTCIWVFEPASGATEMEIASNTYTIDTLRLENKGNFSIKRTSTNGTVYKTAGVSLLVSGKCAYSVSRLSNIYISTF